MRRPSPEPARATSAEPLDLRYPGGKGLSGLAEWIISLQPPHVFYAEPFAGKAGVFRHKPPALRTWLIDSDPEIVAWWNKLAPPGAIVQCGDGIRFAELVAEWGGPDLLCYYDPPYLPEVRTKRRCYRHEMTRDDHLRLLAALVAHRSPAMVSGYWSPLYADQLAGWSLDTREVITRGGTLRTECLWRNPACLQAGSSQLSMEYSALGSSFRERERVHRRLSRWRAKLTKMPRHERRAMMLALIDAERITSHPE